MPSPLPVETDAEKQWQWAYDEARKAGLSRGMAERLANEHVEAERIRRLRELGCPPALIPRIVL